MRSTVERFQCPRRAGRGARSLLVGAAPRALAAVAGAVLATALAAAAPAFASAPTPPFKQCPAVGLDTSCEILIVIEPNGEKVAYTDPSQPPYLTEDTLIGVQNNSTASVESIKLSGPDIFGFDEDGLCSEETSPRPEGCPFGTTGYEGPGTSFTINSFEEGSVDFAEGGLAPGSSTYFSLEEAISLVCETTECKGHLIEPTSLFTSLSGGGQSGASITVAEGTAVKDSATLSGTNASKATGTVSYAVYSDTECKELVKEAGSVEVNGETVPASEEVTLEPGTYYWQASYGGDENNLASKSECGSEKLVVEAGKQPPKPTSVTTSLSGEGSSGEKITVTEGAAVSDTATISGENASKATGTVTYKIYTDSRCEGTAIEAGTVPVNEGKARASEEEVLKPAGTYYWQASYSGDEANEPSTSECGAEVETVLAPTCSKLEGQGTVGEGPELQKVSDKLSTNLLTPPKLQKFRLSWEHGRKAFVLRELEGATCRIGRKGRTFSGHGEGTLNGVPEYVVTFTIKITNEEEVIFTARVRNEKTRELVESFEKEELENSTEVIS